MKTITLKNLQAKVNEIADSVGGLGTEENLRAATRLAQQDETIKGLMLEIIEHALAVRQRNEQRVTISRFVASARKQLSSSLN